MSLFSAFADFLKPPPAPDARLQAAIDHVIGMSDPMLRVLPNLQRSLQPGVARALDYCSGLVDALPGPYDIDHQAFGTEALVHALFATAGDIDEMFGRCAVLQDFFERGEGFAETHFYALLAARRQQKKQFGMAQQGEIIRNDVAQEILYFSDQTLVEPGADLETTRQRLCLRALESLLHSFNAHVEALRHERQDLRGDLSNEQAQARSARQHLDDAQTRHLAELDFRLRRNTEQLMPENLIDALVEFLSQPEKALCLRPTSITIDRLGIIHNESGEDGQKISFQELVSRDRRQHLVMLVRIPRRDAQQALARAHDRKNRYILI